MMKEISKENDDLIDILKKREKETNKKLFKSAN